MKSTHSARLERYLGADKVEELSRNMRDWYGPPIALNGVPGRVFATGDGDFVGDVRVGWEMSMWDHACDIGRRLKRAARVASGKERNRLNAGFTSISDIILEATVNAKKQELFYRKAGPTGTATYGTSSLWGVGTQPQAGGAGSAAPGGRACTSATVGAFDNLRTPTSGDTLHLVSAVSIASIAATSTLLYDRLFDVAKTMSSTATESVTGVPTRYQSTTTTDPDYVGGNFLFVETQTTLSATAHNWTTCTYLDQGGNSSTLPSITGNSASTAGNVDQPIYKWFAPLAVGDTGIQALTQMQCSASVTGASNFVIGHPLAWMVHPITTQIAMFDFINANFNLPRVFDDACLALLEPTRPSTTAAVYNGHLVLVAG